MIRESANRTWQSADATLDAKLEIAAASWLVIGRGHAAEKAKMKGQSGFQRDSAEGNREGVRK